MSCVEPASNRIGSICNNECMNGAHLTIPLPSSSGAIQPGVPTPSAAIVSTWEPVLVDGGTNVFAERFESEKSQILTVLNLSLAMSKFEDFRSW